MTPPPMHVPVMKQVRSRTYIIYLMVVLTCEKAKSHHVRQGLFVRGPAEGSTKRRAGRKRPYRRKGDTEVPRGCGRSKLPWGTFGFPGVYSETLSLSALQDSLGNVARPAGRSQESTSDYARCDRCDGS